MIKIKVIVEVVGKKKRSIPLSKRSMLLCCLGVLIRVFFQVVLSYCDDGAYGIQEACFLLKCFLA